MRENKQQRAVVVSWGNGHKLGHTQLWPALALGPMKLLKAVEQGLGLSTWLQSWPEQLCGLTGRPFYPRVSNQP